MEMKTNKEMEKEIIDFLKNVYIDQATHLMIIDWTGGGVELESQRKQERWREEEYLNLKRKFSLLKDEQKKELYQLHLDTVNFLNYFLQKKDGFHEKRYFLKQNFSNKNINIIEELNHLKQQTNELKKEFEKVKAKFNNKTYNLCSLYENILEYVSIDGTYDEKLNTIKYELKHTDELETDYKEYLETKNKHRLILDKLKNQKNTKETSKFKNILKKLLKKPFLKKEKSKMNNIVNNRIEELNNQSIMSFDAETNGLWGQAFAISTVVYDEKGNEVERFLTRCPIEEEINPWVAENVLPKMQDISQTHENYESMIKSFFDFYNKYKDNVTVLSHMGHIVEAKLIRDAHNLGIIGDWDAPYLWYDVCLLFGDSVDNYVKKHNIYTGMENQTHNPLYDSIVAYKAFKHFVGSVNN